MDFTKLPITIKKSLMQGVTYGEYEQRKYLYSVLAEGDCGTFLAINLESYEIEKQLDLEGATGSWTVEVASDDRVYIGTYTNGGLYRYDHKKGEIEVLLATIPGAKFIYGLTGDENGNIYGGTWPNCAVFKYNGIEERLEYSKEKIVESEDYVRALAIDKISKTLYASISTHASLIEIDDKTGKKRDILPGKYKKDAFCMIAGYEDKKIAVHSKSLHEIFILDTETLDIIKTVKEKDIINTIPVSADSRHFHTTRTETSMIVVDLKNNEFYTVNEDKDQIMMGGFSDSTGEKFIYTSFEGDIYNHDIKSNTTSKLAITIPKKDIELRQIHFYNNKLYGGGYLRGGTFIYDIENNESHQYDGVGQSEGLIAYKDKLYIGKYPGAYIYEYDLLKDWGSHNPKEVFSLKEQFNQDRPFALEAANDQLFIGTIPNYGSTEGALTICNLKNKSFSVANNFIADQSIVSLQAKDGILYGGTTVCGGLGSHTVHESGTLFAYDIAKKEIIFEINPVKGRKNVGGLFITKDNLLLGCADTTLFIYDLKTNKKIYEQYVCVHNPEKDFKWEISFIKRGQNELFYIVTGNRLFSFDLTHKVLEPVLKEKVNLLEIDDKGYLYMQYEHDVRHIIRSKEAITIEKKEF